MPLQERHISELRRLYRHRHGQELSVSEAWAMAHRLLTVYRILSEKSYDPTKTSANSFED